MLPAELVKKNWVNIAIFVIFLSLLSLLLLQGRTDYRVVNATESASSEPGMSREQAIDAAKRTVSNVQRVDAKLTKWAELIRLQDPTANVATIAPNTLVWSVAVQGDYEGSGLQGTNTTYPWAVLIFDAKKGNLLSVAANKIGLWPPYWAAIVDLST